MSRSSVLAHSVDDLPFSEGGDAFSIFTGSVIEDDVDAASAQRSKQLEALVSLGIRLSKLVTAPVQVAQGRRFLADALHLAHQHPGINLSAAQRTGRQLEIGGDRGEASGEVGGDRGEIAAATAGEVPGEVASPGLAGELCSTACSR